MERNLLYVSREIEAQLQETRNKSLFCAADPAVSKALENYPAKAALDKYNSWKTLQHTCNTWIATRQLADVRLYLRQDLLFLRDGIRFISGTETPELLARQQQGQDVYWDLFRQPGFYSCFAPVTVSWKPVGYVEMVMDMDPLLKALDTAPQTGMTLFLTDGTVMLDAQGQVRPCGQGLPESGVSQTVENGSRMLLMSMPVNGYPFRLIGQMPSALFIIRGVDLVRNVFLLLLIVLVCAFLLAWFISRSICLRLEKLKDAMAQVQDGRLNVQVSEGAGDELGDILHAFNLMASQLSATTQKVLHSQQLGRETEFKLMQAQINPHFISNTLESIAWASAVQDDGHVQYLVQNLSHFLRSSLSKTRQMSTLGEELKQIRSYWNIQEYRFGEKIILREETQESAMSVPMLPMLLQPIVENALIHGILPKGDRQGTVVIRAEVLEDILLIEVEDDGLGIPFDTLASLQQAIESQTSGSYGLWNVHQRVRSCYGGDYGLSVHSAPEGGTLCTLTLPVRSKD